MTTFDPSPIGFINFGKSYLDAAKHLHRAEEGKDLSLAFPAPVDFLFAHSIEVMLKGLLLFGGKSEGDLKSLGHNLDKLFDALQMSPKIEGLATQLSKDFQQYWRQKLTDARDRYANSLFEGADEEFGVFDDETIDKSLPCLVQTIKEINDRFGIPPFHSRYLTVGRYQEATIKTFGLNLSVPRCSSIWLGEQLFYRACNRIMENGV